MTFKQIILNRWHFHSLTLILSFLILFLGDKYQIMYLHQIKFGGIEGTEWIFRLFIGTFSALILASFIEWCQGYFYGANKTIREVIGSNQDIIVSTLAGFIGSLMFVLSR